MTRILAINPGSTSTKLGRFDAEQLVRAVVIQHSEAELQPFAGSPVLTQLDLRLRVVARVSDGELGGVRYDAVVGRGGLLAPLPGGTYLVEPALLDDLRAARRGDHASNLGPFLADAMARRSGCAAYIVDPVSVDEWSPVARYSGVRGLDRESLSHALNSRAVARRFAADIGRPYEALRLVVIHLGSGTTVSAHHTGRMVDACNSMEEGPFAMDRAGGVPCMKLLDLAFAADSPALQARLRRRLFGEGGVYSYLGTRDLEEVLDRVDRGDDVAAEVVAAMLYQVAREAGAMAAVLEGDVDAVLVTGGMARAARIAKGLQRSLRWIAPVHVYPGDDELRALAEGAHRVLTGAEPPRRYEESRLRTP